MSEETIIENEIFNYGLIINKGGIHFAKNLAIGVKTKSKVTEFDNLTKKYKIKVVYSTEPKDTFLLKDDIDPLAIDSKYYDWISAIDENLTDKKKNDENFQKLPVYLAILCPEAEMVFENEKIKPSEKFEISVKEALNHYNPYHKLIEIFENYGYFFPRRIVFGYKLYRMCNLIMKNNLTDQDTKWINFNNSNEYKETLNEWNSLIKSESDFDTSYLASLNGSDILINDIKEWISLLKNDPDSSRIINWKELYPLYKIFNEEQQTEIEFILGIDDQTEKFGIKERVLITGVVPVKTSIYEYRVKFPDRLSSSNYKMFGKLISQNGEVIDLASIKFQSTNIFGFSVIIENFDITSEFMNFQIAWMLIGLPSEVGFYSLDTRNIPILALNSYQFTCTKNSIITLKVPDNLPENSVMCTNFIYPTSDYETKFTASIQNYHNDQIKIQISVNEEKKNGYHDNGIENEKRPDNNSYESDSDNDESEISEDQESKYLLQWCIIFLSKDQVQKTSLLNKIGKPIHTSKKMDIPVCQSIHTLGSAQMDIVKKISVIPEEEIDAMLADIDDKDSAKFTLFPEILQDIFETLREIFDITNKAGHNKFISFMLAYRIYVVSQALKKSTKDIRNKYLENCVRVIKICKEFVNNISKSIPFMKLIAAHKIETEYDEITTEFDSAVKDLGLVTCLRTNKDINYDKELFHTEIKTSKHTLEEVMKQTNQQNFSAIEEKLKTIAATLDENSLEANKFLYNSDISHNKIIDLENGKKVKRGNGLVVKKLYMSQLVAQKEIAYITKFTDYADYEKIKKHVSILTELKDCPNIITFYGTMLHDDRLYVISEWAEIGDLNTYLQDYPDLSWEFKLKIARDIANGLAFCHFCDILHHDIRSHNILLTENLTAKISNFSSSRKVNDYTTPMKKLMLIYRWLSPEKLEDYNNPYSRECDIYSFSIVLWELASQKKPFDDVISVTDLIEKVLKNKERPQLIEGTPPEYEEIMKLGWSPHPIKRPTADVIYRKLKDLVDISNN
ncbi:kinase-like protein [Gigaspora margarita]|uniref:Kinase-like protein n=1 Tax=Gigaspora margarita TaxID=4874 RepID=A0A8H4ATE3_GIGMA|nr:kinase-like protein [Gigaspora margarita]